MEMEGNTDEESDRWQTGALPAREPVGSVDAISGGNGWANPNGELGNGVDIWRGWRCGQKSVTKKLEILLKVAE